MNENVSENGTVEYGAVNDNVGKLVKEFTERPENLEELIQRGQGVKFDSGKKARFSLMPLPEMQEVVEVLTKGSEKYADNNWKFVEGGRVRYYDAMQRHIFAWWNGEQLDPETGKSHLAHAMCNALFLMWMDNNPDEEK